MNHTLITPDIPGPSLSFAAAGGMLRSCRSCVTREATKQLLPAVTMAATAAMAAVAATAHPSSTRPGRQGRPGLRVAVMAARAG